MADALKRVMRTKRALAVSKMNVVQTTAMTTFRRRRSLGVSTSSPPSSPPSLPPSDPSALPTLLLLGYECLRCGWWWADEDELLPPLDVSRDICDSGGEKTTTGGSFHTTAGASLNATRFLRKSLSWRMMDKRKQGSRQLPPDAALPNLSASLIRVAEPAINLDRATDAEPLGPSDCRRPTRFRFLAAPLLHPFPASLACRLIRDPPTASLDDTLGRSGRLSPPLDRSPSCSR